MAAFVYSALTSLLPFFAEDPFVHVIFNEAPLPYFSCDCHILEINFKYYNAKLFTQRFFLFLILIRILVFYHLQISVMALYRHIVIWRTVDLPVYGHSAFLLFQGFHSESLTF